MWIAGLLLLALTISSTRAIQDDESSALPDKRRGPWQRQNKEVMRFGGGGGGSRYPTRPWRQKAAPSNARVSLSVQHLQTAKPPIKPDKTG